jgi:hypothetical protein
VEAPEQYAPKQEARASDKVMHEALESSSEEEAGDNGGEQPPVAYRLVLFFSWVLFSLR